MAASEWVDLVWPLFLLTGAETVAIEHNPDPFLVLRFTSYPWTHSLAAGLLWAVALGALYRAITRNHRGAIAIGALILSHWFLDAASHRPDMPLWPGGPQVGLGLWRSATATIAVEVAMFAVGVVMYARVTRAHDRVGAIAFWALVVFLAVVYAMNAAGNPPPSVTALAYAALSLWLVPLWGWWTDRHRTGATLKP